VEHSPEDSRTRVQGCARVMRASSTERDRDVENARHIFRTRSRCRDAETRLVDVYVRFIRQKLARELSSSRRLSGSRERCFSTAPLRNKTIRVRVAFASAYVRGALSRALIDKTDCTNQRCTNGSRASWNEPRKTENGKRNRLLRTSR